MSDWLLLRMSRADAAVSWLIADASGRPLTAPSHGTLVDAVAAAPGRRVALLLAAPDVLLSEAVVPLKGSARASQVIAYALEEQLVGDVESQHFALGMRDAASGRTPVAIVAQSTLDELLAAVRGSGLAPELACSEAQLVPGGALHATAALDGDTLIVVPPGAALPVTLPSADLGAALLLALGADGFTAATLQFVATPADWQRRATEIEALRQRCAALKVQLANAGLLPWLAPQLAGRGVINLLQGPYAVRAAWSGQWQRWRWVAALAGALLALHLGGEALALVRLKRAERELVTATDEFASRVMPGASGSSNLRQRAEQRLLAAQRTGDAGGLLSALGALAGAVPAAGGSAVIETFQFQSGALEVKLRAADADSVERLNQQLRAAGWRAELTAGGAVNGGYEGRIRLVRG